MKSLFVIPFFSLAWLTPQLGQSQCPANPEVIDQLNGPVTSAVRTVENAHFRTFNVATACNAQANRLDFGATVWDGATPGIKLSFDTDEALTATTEDFVYQDILPAGISSPDVVAYSTGGATGHVIFAYELAGAIVVEAFVIADACSPQMSLPSRITIATITTVNNVRRFKMDVGLVTSRLYFLVEGDHFSGGGLTDVYLLSIPIGGGTVTDHSFSSGRGLGYDVNSTLSAYAPDIAVFEKANGDAGYHMSFVVDNTTLGEQQWYYQHEPTGLATGNVSGAGKAKQLERATNGADDIGYPRIACPPPTAGNTELYFAAVADIRQTGVRTIRVWNNNSAATNPSGWNWIDLGCTSCPTPELNFSPVVDYANGFQQINVAWLWRSVTGCPVADPSINILPNGRHHALVREILDYSLNVAAGTSTAVVRRGVPGTIFTIGTTPVGVLHPAISSRYSSNMALYSYHERDVELTPPSGMIPSATGDRIGSKPRQFAAANLKTHGYGYAHVLNVSPNPSTGRVKIEWTKHGQPGLAQLFDVNGAMVLSAPIESGAHVNWPSLPNGQYVLRIISADAIATTQLIFNKR